jgi:hypothetical protein
MINSISILYYTIENILDNNKNKNDEKNENLNLSGKNEKRTFINVHFGLLKKLMPKNSVFSFKTIMLSFAFLLFLICDDNFFIIFNDLIKRI